MTSENKAYLFAPFLHYQPGKEGGKVRKRNSYWVSSYHLVRFISTISAFQELANQEMPETRIGASRLHLGL